jgi:hypothetical protein
MANQKHVAFLPAGGHTSVFIALETPPSERVRRIRLDRGAVSIGNFLPAFHDSFKLYSPPDNSSAIESGNVLAAVHEASSHFDNDQRWLCLFFKNIGMEALKLRLYRIVESSKTSLRAARFYFYWVTVFRPVQNGQTRLISKAEAATLFGVSKQTVERWGQGWQITPAERKTYFRDGTTKN